MLSAVLLLESVLDVPEHHVFNLIFALGIARLL
jgi:hypothetical protein